MLKTGMSESEEVLEYLGGSVAYDLKAAAAKAATRRDLALGPKSKLDGAALNASLDELDLRAKAVAPFWVGPGVDPAPEVLVLADRGNQYDVEYEDTLAFNPGAFATTFSWQVYFPSTRKAEESSLSE